MDATFLRSTRKFVGRLVIPGAVVACLAAVLAACDGDGSPVTSVASSGQGGLSNNTEYRISPQDMLDISVYQVPSLNRTAQVDANGKIDLPLVGPVEAAGRTAREVEGDIAKRLGAKYVQSPQVTVAVKEGLAMRFTVDGAVVRPGVYLAKGETTLLQAIAQAGGLGEVGNTDDVAIARVVDGQRSMAVYNLKAIRTGRAADPPVYGRDTIVVAESATLNTLKFVKDMAGPVIGVARVAAP